MHQRQQRALAALLASPTVAQAAREAGISERTMYRYLDDAEFAEEYARRVDGLLVDAADALKRTSGAAIAALADIAQDANAPPHARVQAARALLDASLRYAQHQDVRAARASMQAPVFIYDRAEAEADIEALFGDERTVISLGVTPKRYEPNGGNDDD